MRKGDSYHYMAAKFHVILHIHHISIFVIIHSVFVPSICTILETSSQLIIAPSAEADITLLSRLIREDLGFSLCNAQKDAHVRDHQYLIF